MEHRLEGQLGQAALYVAGCRCGMARQDVAEIPLALDEVVLVGQDHERITDRRVSVRVELHRVADDVGHLVEAAVVHLEQRVHDPPLDGLQAVPQLRDRAVEDEVARVLDEVVLHQALELAHRWGPLESAPQAPRTRCMASRPRVRRTELFHSTEPAKSNAR